MDKDSLKSFHQAVQPISGGAETLSTSQAQPTDQAPAPPSMSSQTHRRTRVRKTNSPSCNLCRRRKIRCDRADPCSHCVRAGAVCVSSAPSGAARGRKGGRRKVDSELLDRIAKLENLVKNIEGGTIAATPPLIADGNRTASDESDIPLAKPQPIKPSPKAPKEGLDRYLGSSLWMSLSEEIHGMREVLNQSSDEEEDDNELTSKSNSPGESNFVICAPDVLPDIGSVLKHPSGSQVQSLHSFFITNVEPVVKTLHVPSLRRYFVEGSGKIDCSPGPKGWDALKFAIYYTATTSLASDECLQHLGEEKAVLLHTLRWSTELALARADFVNTEDMSTLQALVLYLFANRSNENSRRTWTLTSLAVRIAHALGLHREKCGDEHWSPHPPFMREMRRRLWWQICVLDRQASNDRGSDPIITTNSFSTQIPLHVNDEDLIPGDLREVRPREGFTDMTFSLVCHEVFDIERRLNYIPAGEFERSQESTDDPWAQRRGWVIEGQRRIEDRYLRHCDTTVPFQRYTMLIKDIMLAAMWLFTYRPLQRHPASPIAAKIPHPGILHFSVEVLEKLLQVSMDSCAGPFRWISTIWVQWHSLAVMIAELCVQTEGPTVERAWNVVKIVFEETARHVADSDKGRLWRPIKKMMNKAQAVRKKYLEDAAAISGPLPSQGASNPLNPAIPRLNAQIHDMNGMEMETEMDTNPKLLREPSGLGQQLQPNGTSTEPTSFSWDGWLATGPSNQIDYTKEMDQMAWTNWETFIDDFQANGDFPPQWEDTIPPPLNLNMW